MRPETLRTRLAHVYWIGGGSGAGKSTIARRLAAQYDLRLYSTDDVMSDHASRSTAAECPYLHDFVGMDMDERWLNRSPQTMLETFHWYRGEGFRFIVDDLLRLPTERVIVEGFRLLPQLVKPLLATPDHAAWLLPTPNFRSAAFTSRGSLWDIAGRTSNPERALHNLLERDRLFTARLRAEAARLDVHVIDADIGISEDALTGRVASVLRLAHHDAGRTRHRDVSA